MSPEQTERELRAKRHVSDNLGKNESCISCWIRENPSQFWQKQTHIHIYILSRHTHPQWLTVSTRVESTSFQTWGSITFSQKWGKSEGQSHNRRRGLLCSVFRKRSEETPRGEEEERQKWPFPLNPIWQKYSAAIEILWLQLLIAQTAHDSSWQNISGMKIITDYNRLSSVLKDENKSLKQNWEKRKDNHTVHQIMVFWYLVHCVHNY